MIKLLVDGVFFQLNSTGIARVWHTILTILAKSTSIDIYLLDRGGSPNIHGIQYIPFQTYQYNKCSSDSNEIQKICDKYTIDVFTTTYYTTPLKTPMVLMVYDMIPELFRYDLSPRPWSEKQIAISYAQRYICISNQTKIDLLSLYPEISNRQASVAYCGISLDIFRTQIDESILQFKNKHKLARDYFVTVGSRGVRKNYKNCSLFFDALKDLEPNFDILCVGGEPEIGQDFLSKVPPGVNCKRVELSDNDLALAYGGASALVYPSLYEGFGMPVIEAMASGCPVITTNHGSLKEAAGDAAIIIEGNSIEEMQLALVKVRNPYVRKDLTKRGQTHAAGFSWVDMANQFERQVLSLAEEAKTGCFDHFWNEWARLRKLQASVY